jgi:hypothetical protein
LGPVVSGAWWGRTDACYYRGGKHLSRWRRAAGKLEFFLGSPCQPTSGNRPTSTKQTIPENSHILTGLRHTNGVIARPRGAATVLGVNARMLRSRIKKLRISRPVGDIRWLSGEMSQAPPRAAIHPSASPPADQPSQPLTH